MKISIRWVIIIGCFALVWGTHLIIAPFSFFTTQRVMLDHTRDIMENILELTLKETENYFSVARGAAHLTKRLITSEVVNTKRGNIDKLEQYFFDQLQIYPQFAGIYFADPMGNFYYVNRDASTSREWFRTKIIETGETGRVTRLLWRDRDMDIVRESSDPNDTYDPRVRPWFKKAVETRDIIWTDPYVFFTSQKPGITTAGPVYGPDGSLTGVVGVDIELDVLSRFIGSLRVGKTGLAFMINQDRDVIAFHDLDQLKKKREDSDGRFRLAKLHELDNPVCALAFRAAKADRGNETKPADPAFARFESDGQTYYTMFTTVAASDISWIIGVYIPEADYLGKIIDNRNLNLVITLLVSVLATVLGLAVAGRIAAPIAQLDRAAANIKNNNYDDHPRINTIFKQIQRTADTFFDMKQAVMDYKNELAKKEKIHRAITETANEAIFMVENHDTISFWNQAASRLFGIPADQALGRSLKDLSPFQHRREDDDISLYSLFNASAQERQTVENAELTIFSRQGRRVPVELSMVRIQIQDIPFDIAVVRDISRRKTWEQEKLAIWNQLQQAQKMEAIGTLAGGIAHDFNNILTSIVGNTELLREMLKQDGEKLIYLDAILMAGDRARDLVRQILAFSIQEAHEQKPLQLQEIVTEACRLMKASLPASVTLVRDIAPGCSLISGDATQIHQVALNLMTNAWQAMETTGGTLTVTLREIELTQGSGPENAEPGPGRYLRYSVADTGVGIDKQVMDKIFDPYFTTKARDRGTKNRGTGLGLAVIQGIVRRHGGGIQVASEPGKGTTFHIFLPVADKAPEPVGKAGHTLVLKGTEHILLVDDTKQVLDVQRQMLALLGYRVTARASGTEALETFAEAPDDFDILITDYNMSPMNGDELARSVADLRPGIPIILCTGYNEGISKKELKKAGVREFVTKPVKVKDFSITVRNVLDGAD